MKKMLVQMILPVLALLITFSDDAFAYKVCGVCNYFDPAIDSCQEASGCWGSPGYGYDCGPCATWFADSERGHCETIVGCGGATSARWPQIINGRNQNDVAEEHVVIHNGRGSSSPGANNCFAYNRDGRTCDFIGYSEGQTGHPWGANKGQFSCTNGCLKWIGN